MRIILCSLLSILAFNLNAQTKEEKWNKYISSFQDALAKKDKTKLISLTAPTLEGEGISNTEWANRILSNKTEISKIGKALASKNSQGIGHDKMKCYQSLCLYFDYQNNKWLLVDSVED